MKIIFSKEINELEKSDDSKLNIDKYKDCIDPVRDDWEKFHK